jgi:hypothetical protein
LVDLFNLYVWLGGCFGAGHAAVSSIVITILPWA